MQFFIRRILATVISVACVFAVSDAALAKQSDLKEKITIESDSQMADMNSDHIVFNDNVVIHQGTISITAAKVEVFRENPSKKQHSRLVATGGNGKLAVYEETLDDGTKVHAEGHTMSYDITAKYILVEGKAYVRKHDNEIRSERITYDMRKGQMNATSRSGDSSNRVHTVLIPEQLEHKKDK